MTILRKVPGKRYESDCREQGEVYKLQCEGRRSPRDEWQTCEKED